MTSLPKTSLAKVLPRDRRFFIGLAAAAAFTTASPLFAESTATLTEAPEVLAPAVVGSYPVTERQDVVETLHGVDVADPYRWLEDPEAPKVAAWMEAQDAFARVRLDALPMREEVAKRLRELS